MGEADLTTPWYSYADKKWANVVILQNSYDALTSEGKIVGANPEKNDKYSNLSAIDVYQTVLYNRTLSDEEIKANMSDTIKVTNSEGLLSYVDFTNKKDYEDNEVIPEDIIESYFVWIPKYRYKLWDLGNYDSLTALDTTKVHTIDILFGDYNTSDENKKECTTPMKSGETGNCKVGDYMTHPSFLSIPSTGFWVGKFETGVKGSTTTLTDLDVSKIAIKSNTYGLISNLAVAHLNAYNYKRSLDSHVMKNTEWGSYRLS